MADLDPSHHFFRHIKKSWMEGDFIDPAAFRLRTEKSGQLEKGLSVNWLEYFQAKTPESAIPALRTILINKGRTIGGESKFALLNVGKAKAAAELYVSISVVRDVEGDDPSHSLVTGYEAFNDAVAEELKKVIIATYSAKP